MKALALDLGGTHVECGVIEDKKLLASEGIPLEQRAGLASVLPDVTTSMSKLLQRCDLSPGECSGVAVGFCGIVDPHRGRILFTQDKYQDATGANLPMWSRSKFGLPLAIENDARMALLGESYAGAARGFEDAVMVTLGTGIGVAAKVEGRLLRGRRFRSGCLGGHIAVKFDGRECVCGNVGCAEAEASTWSLPIICREWPGFEASSLATEPTLDFATLFRNARMGDRVAKDIRERCLRVWAAAVLSLVHAFGPEAVVVGGGVMKSAEEVLPAIQAWVHEHAWSGCRDVEIRCAELGDKAVLLGAIPLLQEMTGP